MLVSIVIPAYNVEDYIKDCLDSILQQTYRQIEIIVVNDGSKDATQKVIESYDYKDIKYKIINIDNQGVSKARNIGIDNAQGKYVYFLDSDDLITKSYIENLVSLAEKYNSDICFGNWTVINEKNELQSDYLSDGFSFYDGFKTGIEALKLKIQKIIWMSPGTVLYKRDFLNQHNLRFSEGYAYGEDIHFINECLLLANVVTCTKEDHLIYRVRMGSALNVSFNNKFFDAVYLSQSFFNKVQSNSDLIKDDKNYLLELIKNDYNNLLIGVYRRMVDDMCYKEFKSVLKKVNLSLFPLKGYYLRTINTAWKFRYHTFLLSDRVGYYALKLEKKIKSRGKK